ncbi:hypothetical protein FM106_06175 [Brachybacterium faecium]|nr:hypothetical protein FM106_06175 [Brachybacterium faecium]
MKGPMLFYQGGTAMNLVPFWRRGFLFCPKVQTFKGGLP